MNGHDGPGEQRRLKHAIAKDKDYQVKREGVHVQEIHVCKCKFATFVHCFTLQFNIRII